MRLRTLGGLWIEDDPAPAPSLGPRRTALLAIVAAAGRGGITRDRVLGILWAEHDERSARHSLAQTAYSMRLVVGRELIVASPALRLAPGVTSDVGDLRDALGADDHESVASLYTGDFLDGFYLSRAPEFERWVEEERRGLRSAALRAIEQLAIRTDERGDPAEALHVWRRLTELEPLSARYAASLMRGLAAVGDRPAAVQHARTYEELVRRELDSEPDPSIRRLEEWLRDAGADGGSLPPVSDRRATLGDAPPAGRQGRQPGSADLHTPSVPSPASATPGRSRSRPSGLAMRHLPWVAVLTLIATGTAIGSFLAGPYATEPDSGVVDYASSSGEAAPCTKRGFAHGTAPARRRRGGS